LQGIARRAASHPLRDYREELNWSDLVGQGIARSIRVSNREVQGRFAGSRWEHDDPEAEENPEGDYLDLWVVDVGPPSIARAVLSPETLAAMQRSLDPFEEPVLLLSNGRHRLVDEDFVRNSSPSRITAIQDGLPVTLRDADIETRLATGVPSFEQAMILRADTRLGFDPASPWTLVIRAVREHQSFQPEPGARDFEIANKAPNRFFDIPSAVKDAPAWFAAVQDRAVDFWVLILFVAPLLWVIARRLRWLARHPRYPLIRLGILVFTVGFVGWWAQGQLSIVTPLGVVRNLITGSGLSFLLYEPFILLVWVVTLVSLLVWGRGFFCGWLCPYGALQEFAFRLGRLLRLPKLRIHPADDRRLKWVKYLVLALLVVATLTSETAADLLIELEPFKTAVTLHFDRAPPFVLYAGFWLVLGLFMFKGFCRYVCPLGAVLAIAGKFRRLEWIGRRAECGSPCQFCKARCEYGAIEPSGKIDYDECFQCLDCVTIIEDPRRCIPERLARKKGRRKVMARR
jgi:ferredoxin